MPQSPAGSRGAGLVTAPEMSLPRSAASALPTSQTRTAGPSASMHAPSMAELTMILKTLQTL
eukprot:12423704-Karenia_brevis.AAC.1